MEPVQQRRNLFRAGPVVLGRDEHADRLGNFTQCRLIFKKNGSAAGLASFRISEDQVSELGATADPIILIPVRDG